MFECRTYMRVCCVSSVKKVINFKFPNKEKLERIGKKERLNLFRRYFAASRYDRLMIQKHLIKSAYNGSAISEVTELERSQGIQRIIEAYDKRIMNQPLS